VGAYSTPKPLAAFKRPTSNGRGREGKERERGGNRKRGPHIQTPPWALQNLGPA